MYNALEDKEREQRPKPCQPYLLLLVTIRRLSIMTNKKDAMEREQIINTVVGGAFMFLPMIPMYQANDGSSCVT